MFFNRITLCLFIFSSSLFSTEFIEKTIPNISSNRVLSINQDSLGFIWIGTDEGLNRFDGFSNKIYRSNIFKENTISGNRVWIIWVDENKTVWVGTDRGMCYYDSDYDFFHRIDTGSRPIHIIEEKENIYFTTRRDGVYMVNKKTKKVNKQQFDPLDPFSLSSSKFNEKQTKPMVKSGEHLWVGTTNGLNKIKIKTRQNQRFYSGKNKAIRSDSITALLIKNNNLFIGTTKGLGILDLQTEENQKLKGFDKNEEIISIFKLEGSETIGVLQKDKIVFIRGGKITQTIKTPETLRKVTDLGTDQYLITSKDHNRAIFLTNEQEKNESKKITSQKTKTPIKARNIFIDKENGVWMVGEEGLVRAENIKSPITIEKATKTKIETFAKVDNRLYILKDNNIVLYEPNQKPKTVFYDVEKSNKNALGLFITKKGTLFVFDRSLVKYYGNKQRKKLASFDAQISKVVSNETAIYVSLKNSGLVHYDIKTKKITDYRKNRMLSRFLPTNATSLFLDKTTLWVGSNESGLYEIDIENPKNPKLVMHHTYDKNNSGSFSSSSVSCLYKQEDRLFIGTNGDGFFVYDKRERSFSKISITDGLPSNNIVSITGSKDSLVWVLSNGGLSLVNWITKDNKNIGKQEGLKTFLKDENALIPKKGGNVSIVSPFGVQVVRADQIHTNEFEPKVFIESVELIDKNNKIFSTTKNNPQVTHKKPTIRINLTAPSIYKAEEITFSYFIDGYNDKWVDNGKRRYVEAQGLAPGSYVMQIKAYNSDGLESENIESLGFQVVPPWWKTWWAYFLYVLFMLFVFTYYVGYQKKAQKKASEEKRKEEELEQARQFQLNMLPKKRPKHLNLDIAAEIKTASEVGGDYYDFFPQKDKKSIYVVVGDATGHGMIAGMMVSITKAGLYGIPSIPPNEIASRLNTVIKNIDLGLNRMAINMARFWENHVEITSAAMPPVYHYRGRSKKVDEVLIEGLPLGSIKNETFTLKKLSFVKGDSLVFISDGLPEAINSSGEMLGYEAVFKCIETNGNSSAEKQKKALLQLGESWLSGLQNQDDITIVVVKKL